MKKNGINYQISSLDKPSYQAHRFDKDGNIATSALIEILDPQVLGSGFYGSVAQVQAKYKGKELPFAIKEYQDIATLKYAIKIHQLLKQLGIPTRNTYRQLENTTCSLMSLGNADGGLIFSPHNQSKDAESVKNQNILRGSKIPQPFLEQALAILLQATKHQITLAWDSYFLKIKEGEISLLVGDFDQIGKWKRPNPYEVVLASNIEQFGGMLLELEAHMGAAWFEEFFDFLIREQKKGNLNSETIDLASLRNKLKQSRAVHLP